VTYEIGDGYRPNSRKAADQAEYRVRKSGVMVTCGNMNRVRKQRREAQACANPLFKLFRSVIRTAGSSMQNLYKFARGFWKSPAWVGSTQLSKSRQMITLGFFATTSVRQFAVDLPQMFDLGVPTFETAPDIRGSALRRPKSEVVSNPEIRRLLAASRANTRNPCRLLTTERHAQFRSRR
jgi:hypothetical protein